MFVLRRSQHNPIISPTHAHPWESYATFNGCPIQVKKITHLVYRAQGTPERFENTQFSLSVIGKAESSDGASFTNRKIFISPTEEWERYGCEDPRVTRLGNTYYTFYTALSTFPFTAGGIRVAVAISKDLETIEEKHLCTPFNAKAMTLFPEKINGKFTAILTAHTDAPPSKTAIIQFEKEEDMWSEKYWKNWFNRVDDYTVHLKRGDNERIEIGAPPVKTKYGWLLVYSHIQKYYSSDKIFGIEAVLLDLKDPRKIIGRTRTPILVPEESYEKYGIVPNVIFPSGCLIEEDMLKIFYGGADTVCATAYVNLENLLESIMGKRPALIRSDANPILKPTARTWEKKAVFNPTAIELDGTIHLLYRAMSNSNTTVFGYAATKDGITIINRSMNPVYLPRESFERKGIPNGNSGCEDPRITEIGSTLYVCYTAFNGVEPPAVALTSISVTDFKAQRWNWTWPVLVSPPGIDDKDACIVPLMKDKKYLLIHRIHNAVVGTYIDIEHPARTTDHVTILEPRPGMWDSQKVGLTMSPIKTNQGWLMMYHGVSNEGIYRIGLALLDSTNPTKVLARTTDYIFEPEEYYEKEGIVPNVVFPCGGVVRKNKLFVYYGGGDKVIGCATANLNDLLDLLK